ncbi:zinc ribbon domain-containing protein [Nonomuraea sp. NPDC050310]|uniref:zinc ribbon domain-containing protein n=1 Tax=unclassified Nonomuraea TaxID=2593643 RepID=UPI0034066674
MARVTALAAGAAAALLVCALPALAHEHPSGITDLVTPSVVRVEASQRVDITLLDHIGDLVHIERSYEVPLGSGTGIVVNPEGAVVTLTRVVKSEQDAAIYAANKIFAEHHKVKVPGDFAKHELKDPLLNRHLQACYPPKRSTATCIAKVTTTVTVFPNINPPDAKGFAAEVASTGDKPDSPAVLVPSGRADGSVGLPTAPLAQKVPDQEGSPTSIAGFLGRPSPTLKLTTEIAHLGKGGAGEGGRPFSDPYKKVDEPVKLGALVDKGMLGAPVIGDKDGHVIGLLIGGGKDARMIGVREITAALNKAGIPPRRGAVDAAFEHALTRFHTKYYTEATPGFQRVLDLYPGHTVAAEHLKTSLAKRGTAEDQGTARQAAKKPVKSALPLWPFIAAAAVLLVAALAGIFLLWRRRRAAAPEPAAPPPGPVPPPVAAARTPVDEGAHQTVVVRRSQIQDALQQHSQSHSQPQPVLTAQEVKFCTACGMKLGRGHRFCGFCGHPSET